MKYSVVNTKTQKVKFGSWPFQKRLKTKLQLVSLGDDYYRVYYSSEFNNINRGKIEKIKVPCNGYVKTQINNEPGIKVEIYNCSSEGNYIAIHVKIKADMGSLGVRTIYDQILDCYTVQSKNWNALDVTSIWKNLGKIKKQIGYTFVDQYAQIFS